jgi:hypothetical protein
MIASSLIRLKFREGKEFLAQKTKFSKEYEFYICKLQAVGRELFSLSCLEHQGGCPRPIC